MSTHAAGLPRPTDLRHDDLVAAGRHHVAAALARAAGWASRVLGRGTGASVTGRILLLLSPGSLHRLARGRRVVLVSGTNGKTTTSAMLAACWSAAGPVCANEDGANLREGAASWLLRNPAEHVVLEVDELALPSVIQQTAPELVVLLNLSRDQMDRVGEVAGHVRRWREVLTRCPVPRVIANADDPLVVGAVRDAHVPVTWVSAGLVWQRDASVCTRCRGTVVFPADGWRCERCGRRRPEVTAERVGTELHVAGCAPVPLELQVDDDSNAANAAMALVAAHHLGLDLTEAAARLAALPPVRGRFAHVHRAGHDVEVVLVKNPAGGATALARLSRPGDQRPVVIALNGRAADGRDTSWIWDVPFEQLRGRQVVVTGERATDAAVRLSYADVRHVIALDLDAALALLPDGPCVLLASYTAFTAAHAVLVAAAA